MADVITVKRILACCFDRFWRALPESLDARADCCLILTLPVIMLKAFRKIIFQPRRVELKIDSNFMESFPPKDFPPGTESQEIAIRYSGGDDSTLNAAIAALRFRRVHLLTFKSGTRLSLFGFINSDPNNAKVNICNLAKKFGADKFRHHVIDFAKLRNDIYFRDFASACGQDLFLRSCFCIPCTLAMHIETIVYCLQNGVYFASDGSNVESGLLPWQMQSPLNLREMARFYKQFGIDYVVNPKYYLRESDAELNRLGVHDIVKAKTNYRHRRKTQQFCHLIQVQTLCRRLCGSKADGDSSFATRDGILSRLLAIGIPEYKKYVFSRVSGVARISV